MKVEMVNADEHGVTQVQYYFKGDRLLFTLDRSETTLMMPKAPTDVVERRYYFANKPAHSPAGGEKGRFAEGTPTDTTDFKNRELPVNAEESAGETYTSQHELAAAVIERVRKLEDDSAGGEGSPAAIASAGEGWRMIAGSGSRDGIYALAWGLKGKPAPGGEADEDGDFSVDPDDPELVNYAVNIRTKEILGVLKGRHFGDKSRYNHMTNETEWSSDSMYVTQVCNAKWDTSSAFVYQLQEGMSVSPGVDLIAPATTAIFKKLKGGPAAEEIQGR